MIVPRTSDQLLLPVNPLFVAFTLLAAFGLNLMPLGRVPWAPDLIALVLAFWNVHQSHRIGVGIAFVFGMLADVRDSAVLGQHALSYTLLAFFAIAIHRRLLWFSVPSQALQVLPLFALAHGIELALRMIAGSPFPGWWLLLAPLLEAAIWPLAALVLLAPQRWAPHPDENHPL